MQLTKRLLVFTGAWLVIGATATTLLFPGPGGIILSMIWAALWAIPISLFPDDWKFRNERPKRKRKIYDMSIWEAFWEANRAQLSNLTLGWRLRRMTQQQRIDYLREMLREMEEQWSPPYPDEIIDAIQLSRDTLRKTQEDSTARP